MQQRASWLKTLRIREDEVEGIIQLAAMDAHRHGVNIAVIDFGNTGRNVVRRGHDGGSQHYLPPEFLRSGDRVMEKGEEVGGAAARLLSSVRRLPG